jgi:O-antigen ligase
VKTVLFILVLFSFVWSKTVFSLSFGSIAGLNISNIVIYVSIITIVITDFSTGKIRKGKIPGVWIIIGIVVFLFTNFVYASTNEYANHDFHSALTTFKRMYLDPLLLYVLACLLIDSRNNSLRYLMVIVVFFSILNIVSLAFLKMNINFFVVQEHSESIVDRFTGFIGNPNKTSYMLCFLLPFLFYFVKIHKNILLKLFFFGMIATNILTVVLSGSRGGALALIGVVLSLFILNKDYLKLVIFSVFSGVGFAYAMSKGVVFSVYERFFPLLDSIFSKGLSEGNINVSSGGRFTIWSDLFSVYSSDYFTILFGLGLGNSEHVGMKADPHNFYLQVLTEFGVTGFIVFLMVIFYFTITILIKKTETAKKFKFYVISAWIAILVAWMFSSLDGIMNYVLLTMGVAISCLNYMEGSTDS